MWLFMFSRRVCFFVLIISLFCFSGGLSLKFSIFCRFDMIEFIVVLGYGCHCIRLCSFILLLFLPP